MGMLTDTGKVVCGIIALKLSVLVTVGSVGGIMYIMERQAPTRMSIEQPPLTQAEIDFLNTLRESIDTDKVNTGD